MTATTRPADLGARLLGGVGAALLLAAAISVVSARWEFFGPGARLGSLLVASGVLVVLTGQIRRLAPSTAQMLDVLVAAMVPIDTAAAVIVTGGSWRTALVAAGPVTAAVGAVLRQRLPSAAGDLAIGIGGVLTAAGVAAEFEVHGPLLLAGLALITGGVVTDRRDRRVAVAWAVVAGLAPAGRVFDEVVFTGMGTLREIGLITPAPLSVALGTGVLAVGALVVVAVRDRAPRIGVAAVGVALTTGLEVWATADPPSHVGLLAVAVLIGLVELVDVRRLRLAPAVGETIERVNEAALVVMTAVVAGGSWMLLIEQPGLVAETPITAGVVAAAWVVGQVRRGAQAWLPALPGFVVAGAATVHLASDDPRLLGAGVLIGALLAVATPRRGATATALTAAALAPLLVLPSDDWAAVAVAAWAAIVLVVGAVRRASTAEEPLVAIGLLTVLVHGALAVGAGSTAWSDAPAVAVVSVLWWSAGLMFGRVQPAAGFVLRTLALMGPLALSATSPVVAFALGLALSVAAGLELAWVHRSSGATSVQPYLALVGAAVATTWVAGLRAAEIELVDLYVVPLLWLAVAGAVHVGVARTAANLTGLAATAAIAIGGRVDDGLSAHTAILGAVAVAVAVVAGRAGDRSTLVVAGPVAVAAATFDLLDRSVGVESWGWLLVGGAAAVSAAIVLERRDADAMAETSIG